MKQLKGLIIILTSIVICGIYISCNKKQDISEVKSVKGNDINYYRNLLESGKLNSNPKEFYINLKKLQQIQTDSLIAETKKKN